MVSRRCYPVAFLLGCLWSCGLRAAVPPTIPFQGVLTNATGTPKPDGTYTVSFSLYDALTGGNLLWSESGKSVQVQGGHGVFTTALGDTTALSGIAFDQPYFVEIAVGSDPPMTPRLPLRSVPYALTASSVPAGSITADRLSPGLQQAVGGFGSGQVLLAGNYWNRPGTGQDIALGDSFVATIADDSPTLWLYGLDPNAPPALGLSSISPSRAPNSVATYGGYVYVGEFAAGVGGSPTIQVFDARNPSNIVQGINFSTATDTPDALIAANGYLYSLEYETLEVYSLANPAAPAHAGTLSIGSWLAAGQARGNYLYLVTKFGTSHALLVCDVSNPASPRIAGQVALPATASGIAVAGDWAYVTQEFTGQIVSVNVANPVAPTLGPVLPVGPSPRSVATDGQFIFVVDSRNSTISAYEPTATGDLGWHGSMATGYIPVRVVSGNGVAYVTAAGRNMQPFAMTTVPEVAKDFAVLGSLNVLGLRPFPINLQTFPGQFGYTHTDGNVVLSTYVDYRGGWLGTVSPHNLNFYTGNSGPEMTLDAYGQVGIGTAAPDGQLQIAGGNAWTSNGWTKALNLQNGGAIEFGNNAPIKLGIGNADSRMFFFSTTTNDNISDAANYRMMIDGGTGNVGINNTTPAYTLDVNGTIRGNNVSPSDVRLKTNVTPLTNGLGTVLGLRGVTFDWRRDEFPDRGFPEGRQVGFIAQEVEPVLPEVVSTDANGYKSVAYQSVVPVLVEAVKEQQREIEDRDRRIALQQSQINSLEKRLTRLEKAVASGHR